MISPEELSQWIDDLYADYSREIDQAILQRDMAKAERALAGKEACQRIRTRIEARTLLPTNVAHMPRGRR